MKSLARRSVRPLQFFDISGPDGTGPLRVAFGVDLPAALERMHAIDGEGNLRTGAAAFVAMWACLPAPFHWVAMAARAPLAMPLLELGYKVWTYVRVALTGGTTTAGAGASCRAPRKDGKQGGGCS